MAGKNSVLKTDGGKEWVKKKICNTLGTITDKRKEATTHLHYSVSQRSSVLPVANGY